MALDLRGHGHTTCEPETDLSADTLAQDATAAWQHLFGAEAPPTVLLGHSMGGAVAVRAAASKVCLMFCQDCVAMHCSFSWLGELVGKATNGLCLALAGDSFTGGACCD